MDHFEWTCLDKLSSFEAQLDKISASEFIRPSTVAALGKIRGEIHRLRRELRTASKLKEEKFLWPAGVTINRKIFSLTNSLGVLLRSTNLRNCFEACFALEEVVENLIGYKDILIISSEWDASPFFIPEPPDSLKEYVFIGMPAFISRNALFLPLTSHEIGHAIWRRRQLDGRLSTTAEYKLKTEIDKRQDEFDTDFGIKDDMFEITRREDSISNCLRVISSQSQEIFCDLFGARLFGRSFAFAFDYHLAPGVGRRDSLYPSFADRAQYIRTAALNAEEQQAHPDILSVRKTLSGSPKSGSVLVKWADLITADLRTAIENEVEMTLDHLRPSRPNMQGAAEISRSFRNYTPPDRPKSLMDILNAAWDVLLEKTKVANSAKEKDIVMVNMNHLCIKALEVYELNRRHSISRSKSQK